MARDSKANRLPTIEISDINKSRGTVRITQDKRFYAEVAGRLKPYKSIPYIFRPAMERMADYYRIRLIPEVFEREGPGWAPLAQRTVNERLKLGFGGRHPILRRTGDLFNELTERSHPKHVEIIKTGRRARIEIGGASKKFLENQAGRNEMSLPKRAMLPGTGSVPLQPKHRIEMRNIIANAIKEKMRK